MRPHGGSAAGYSIRSSDPVVMKSSSPIQYPQRSCVKLFARCTRGLAMLSLLALSGCMSMVSSFTSGFATDLGNSILDNPDVEMV